jgi:hypothetical protein
VSTQEPTALEQEMHVIACRLREKYDLDTVVVLGCKQESFGNSHATDSSFALSGNAYAGKYLARKYSM